MQDNIYEKLSAERKQLQEQGLVPEWYTTAGWQMFKSKYLYGTDRAVRGQFERIAKTAAKHLKGTKYESDAEEKFFNMLWKGWLSPSTPVLANMGTNRGMPVSCSGTIAEDSIDGFYKNLHEVAMLTKYGFGTATDLSDIRPRGSKISVGGKANGVLPVIKEHIQAMRNVAQGTARRGAWAAYLDIEHGDFDEVANYVLAEPDDCNIGWKIRKSFIDRLNAKDEEALRRFQRALKVKMVTGKGYFFFQDKANAKRPQMYVDKGMFINNSQLCVAPETLILTDQGYKQISELQDREVSVWNGEEFSKVTVRKTGENQKLLKVVTNSGLELECTPYHKFYVAMRNPTSGNRWLVEKRAHELKPGDKLIKCNFPIIQGNKVMKNAYENGLFSAEGCEHNGKKFIYLYHEKRKLKQFLDQSFFENWVVDEKQNRECGYSSKLSEKFFVPHDDYTVESKINWFAGLCDGDSTVARNGKTQSIQVCSINKSFLLKIQMMLQTLGVSSKVTLCREEGYNKLPSNNGTGELKDYWTQSTYRLLIGQTGINNLQSLGFNPRRLILTDHTPNRECTQFVKIVEVIDEGRVDDTYCFTEPKRGMGVFNGILTGQCSEIMLFNDEDHTYTCQPGFAKVIKQGVGLTDFDNIKVGDKVWSKEGWTTVVNKVSSGVKHVFEYRTSLGSFIGTQDHRVVEFGEKIEVRHAESIDGVKYEYQKVEQIVPEFVIYGLVTGDGTIRNGKVQLCVGEKDQDYYTSEISHMIEHKGYSFFRDVKINTTGCEENTYDRVIDLTKLTDNDKIASFLRGLFSVNGSVIKQSDSAVHVILTCTSKNVADNTMLLLQALGLSPKIYKSTGKEVEFSNGTYLCKDVYRVVINKSNDISYFESNIGFIQKYKCQLLAERRNTTQKNRRLNAQIKEVNYIGDFEVFHIEVDNNTHTYWTGGLDVSNCVLSSLNVAKYDEWKDTDAPYWATIFLDCVASEFIEKAEGIPGLEKAVRFTKKGRALGLGLCGIHTLFMQKMLPFESFEAHMLSQEVSANIWQQASHATQDMAKELGEPEWCEGYGVRNTHLIAIAPTKSTALIMGGVSEGINPDPAMTFTQMTAAGEVDRVNPVLLDLMKKKGVYTKKHVQQIVDANGSVQNVDWLTDEEKAVFKTAFEINQTAVLRLASARSRYIDQWQSLNLFFAADEDPAWIAQVHKQAFEDQNILALYYIYTQAGVQASKGECEACQ